MNIQFADQLFKYLHHCIFALFLIFQVFQANPVHQVHVPAVQFAKHFQAACLPVLGDEHEVACLAVTRCVAYKFQFRIKDCLFKYKYFRWHLWKGLPAAISIKTFTHETT